MDLEPLSAAAGGLPGHRGDPFVSRPPRDRPRGDLRRPLAGPDGGAGLRRRDPGRQPAGFAPRPSLYALGFTTLGAALFALTRTDEKGRCRRRRSSASCTSWRRPPRSWWPTARRAAARRSRTSWWAACSGSPGRRSSGWPAVYAVIGVFHWVLRRRFLTISFQPGDRARQRLEHPVVGFPVLSLVRHRDHLLGADRRRAAGVLVPGGAGGDRLSVHPAAGRAGRRLLAGRRAGLGRRALGLVPLRPADRAGGRLHVRAAAARRVRFAGARPGAGGVARVGTYRSAAGEPEGAY